MQQALRSSRVAAGPLATSKGSRRGVVRVHASADTDFASYKPNVAAFFPGQGAQTVGMAKDLVAEVPAAKEMFNKASDILGYDLLQLCTEGPKERLDSTEISQPAIYVASLAAVEKLRATEGQAAVDAIDVTCGLSLGEYTALAFAGAMSFEDGLRLVKLRGESMQAAANAAASGMVSVIGLDSGKVAELCKAASAEVGKEDAVKIANYLCPGNYAVSGSKEACDAVERLGKPNFKARMTVRLAVAGAFHTDFMQPAVEKLQAALAQTEVKKPRIPVISNVDAMPHSDPETIKSILARQVTSPVLWENTLTTLFDKGLTRSYEIGPGKVVAGIAKRINKEHNITNIFA
uniref:Malonyl-CoA:ACP transacylase (MAT) domain-containing protein n=1 Tax=Dunaliella tertiolecta TaxID=3047 RepID=A0A6S8KQM9_DUNTE|mmetsp:Transcript_6625/g.15911  ORF Transcript_6625/g.15911 Transcript_6625/m.15911 type:complete len:348 (-) Transcript_6625:320-1363(-)